MLDLRLFATSTLFVALALGCARGDSLTGTGAGSEGGSGDGGIGEGAGSSGGDSANNVTATNTTSGPACDEDPCKLVAPQCGCPTGSACTVDGPGSRACVEEGPAGEGEPCNEATFCEAGTICVGYATDLTSCSTYCNTDADCQGPGAKCAIDLTDSGGVTLCSQSCELVTAQGCALPGTSCQIGLTDTDEPFTLCAPSGAGVAQAPCADTGECAPGFVCLPTETAGDLCFEWCNVASSGTCPPELPTCTGLDAAEGTPLVIGTVHYGVCNPPT